MSQDLTYYRYDIEHWLDENEEEIGWADTPEEFAENAVLYHNHIRCRNRCQCIDENLEFVAPKLSPYDQIWFKEIARERIAMKWGVYIMVNNKVDRVTGKNVDFNQIRNSDSHFSGYWIFTVTVPISVRNLFLSCHPVLTN